MLELVVGELALVLRRHRRPGDRRADAATAREAAVLHALEDSGVPHPALVGSCPEPGVLDTAFFVMAVVDGVAMPEADPALPPDVLAERALAVVDALAGMESVDPARAMPDRRWGPDRLAAQPSRWQALLATHEQVPGYGGLTAADAEPLVKWLERSIPATGSGSIVHGDLHLGNVLFEPGGVEVRALVDWELATVGDPRLDLGWLLVTSPLGGDGRRGALGPGPWCGFPSRDAFVSRFDDVASSPTSDLEWFEVLAALKLASILEGTGARAVRGLADFEIARRLHEIAVRVHATAMEIVDA